jgi:hypothetical protein
MNPMNNQNDVVRFDFDVPVEVAMQFDGPKEIETQFGERVLRPLRRSVRSTPLQLLDCVPAWK